METRELIKWLRNLRVAQNIVDFKIIEEIIRRLEEQDRTHVIL